MDVKLLQPGDQLPPLQKEPISKVQLVKYAGASDDYNLIHTDVETARAVGLPGVIAHGMLSMGFLGQYMTNLAGPEGVRRLKVRFVAMVRLGDLLTCHGQVKEISGSTNGNGQIALLDLWIQNADGERVVEGEAEVLLPH